MAGRGPRPKTARRRTNTPARGEWRSSPGIGWQHGSIPEPTVGVHAQTLEVWQAWMQSWVAAHWEPVDLPGLNLALGLYDQVTDYLREPMIEKEYVTTKGDSRTVWVPKPNPAAELRQLMDNYGITPKGQQDRRWTRPEGAEQPGAEPAAKPESRYGHLQVVNQ